MSALNCPTCAAEVPEGSKFCGACGTKLPGAAVVPAQSATSPPRDEFRDVTILFADVTGFTAMAERLDPEAMQEIMNACFDGLGRIVKSHGGHIDKYIGDSIMALFGAPTAHEDDPLRAADAALDMQAFLAEFSAGQARGKGRISAFRMRIGLNCGLVLAGAIGAKSRRDYSVMGDAVNIASRLESAAEPGTILASHDFKRRVERQFAFGPPRVLRLKGKDRPIEAYVLEGERANAGSGALLGDEPFMGRVRELTIIDAELRTASVTSPWIEVRGPVGIGKSRLADVAVRRDGRYRVIHAVARPATAARPFAMMRRVLHAIGQELSESGTVPQTREAFFETLRPVSAQLEPYANAIWYIAAPDALGVKAPDPDALTFRRTLERGLSILLANLTRLAERFVIVLDDHELADTQTREFLGRAAEFGGSTFPPTIATLGADAAFSRHATATIDLSGLESGDALDLIHQLTLDAPLDATAGQDIVRRAGGVPLFIKELVLKVQDDASAGDPEARGTRASGTSALPSSLLGLMMSRLDRLGSGARDFLAQCSVQGPEFSRAIAGTIWQQRNGSIQDVAGIIGDLEERQLIVPSGGERYAFAQLLMQNACYNQMLRRDRRDLHKAVACALVAAAGSEYGVSPEILANHYECSDQWFAAAQQNVRAGDRAGDLFANTDALARYARALTALDELGAEALNDLSVGLAANRGAALVRLRIGDYPSLRRHADSLFGMAVAAEDRAEALRLQAQGNMHVGEIDAADRLLTDARALVAVEPADGRRSAVGGRIAYDHADVCYRLGRNDVAAAFIVMSRRMTDPMTAETIRLDILEGRLAHTEGRFDAASALYERAHRDARAAGSLSEEALSSNYMGNAARDRGRYDEAEAYFSHALEVWTRTGNTEAIAGAHNNLANLAISRGNDAEASRHYSEALGAFDKIGNAAGKATALMNLSILAIECRDPDAAVERATAARALLEASGNRVLLGLADVIQGEALIDARRHAEAEASFEKVLSAYTDATHPLARAGAFRGLGRLRLADGAYGAAIDALGKALDLFERLRRVQEAARTEIYLAQAREGRGDAAQALDHLDSARRKFLAIGAVRDLARAEARLSGDRASN